MFKVDLSLVQILHVRVQRMTAIVRRLSVAMHNNQ